jgi:hypothetical protein
MFQWLTGSAPEKKLGIRDTLFADLPFDHWQPKSTQVAEPWTTFARAKQFLEGGDKPSAIATFTKHSFNT